MNEQELCRQTAALEAIVTYLSDISNELQLQNDLINSIIQKSAAGHAIKIDVRGVVDACTY